jgi:diguanylate cyclase (GGDEF)-like protein
MSTDAPESAETPFSLFEQEESTLREAERMISRLGEVAQGVEQLAQAYRQSYREQRRMLRISDRLQLDLQRANQTLAAQAEELRKLNAALEEEAARREALARELHRLATVDTLTGVFTRRHALELGHAAFARSMQAGEPLSVLLMDIDLFKSVNDRHGHAGGDALLQRFGALCGSAFGAGAIVGRMGGEEFVAVLPSAALDAAAQTAERFRAALAQTRVRVGAQELAATVSIGVAERGAADASLDRLISRADEALYAAKRLGRNRVQCAA